MASTPRSYQRNIWYVTAAVFVTTAVLGYAGLRWYAAGQLIAAKDHVRSQILPLANTSAAATGRQLNRLVGLKSFVESRDSYAQLQREFPRFAAGLMKGAGGIRAAQVVRDGRIALVYPLSGNEGALGLNLRDSESGSVRDGFQRTMRSDTATVFGPTTLVQGGKAFVLDQRARAAYDPSINFVSMLVDLDSVIRAVGLRSSDIKIDDGIAVLIADSAGQIIDTLGGALPADPVLERALVRGGSWQILAGPRVGWRAYVNGRMRAVQATVVLLALLLTFVAWRTAGRQSRLESLIEVRTESLSRLAEERRETIERQQATERALAASEDRLRRALYASRTATYEIDALTGAMVWSNGVGHVVGRDPEGSPDTFAESISYLEPEDAKRAEALFGNARRTPSQGNAEMRAVRADGSRVWLNFTWLSSADADGVVRRVLGTMTDISERKKLEEQFLHAQKMQAMGALAGGIAHDFNNLLTVILGAGQMARTAADAPGVSETIRTDLDEVIAASERASVLTGQLLAFSRRQVVQPKHFDACDLVGGMGTMLRRLVGERIRVETALPGTRVPLFADQGQLTQVLMNLAVNARDAMPQGGVLRISLRTAEAPSGPGLPNETLNARQYAVFSVSDDGVGIAPEIRPLIFDPFFTTKPVGKGTGLGLATVYGIVIQLGGTIRVKSEVGKGSTFDVYVPLGETVAADVPVSVSVPSGRDGAGRVILLAEDEPGLRKVVERALRHAGYEVLVAEDGVRALALSRSREGPIDLLISDVVMPGMDGAELATTLRGERPTLRVLLMSGYPHGPGHESPALVTDFPLVPKPFKPSDLLAAARRVLSDA